MKLFFCFCPFYHSYAVLVRFFHVVGADRSSFPCRVRRTKPGIFEEPEADSPDQLLKMLLTEGQNGALPAGKLKTIYTADNLQAIYYCRLRPYQQTSTGYGAVAL